MGSLDTNRYYRLNSTGHLAYAQWLDATNDADAIAQVESKFPRERSEIWQGTRLVARLSPTQCDEDNHEVQEEVGSRLSALALKLRCGQEPSA